MVTKYEWIVGGGTYALGETGVPHLFPLVPVHGKALKRVMCRGLVIQGTNSATTSTVVEPIVLQWDVFFDTGEFDDAFNVFRHTVQLPHTVTAFFADAIDLYNIWWHGGDENCGFDQEILRGKVSDVEGGETLVALTPWGPGTFNYEDHISVNVEVRALYSYLG